MKLKEIQREIILDNLKKSLYIIVNQYQGFRSYSDILKIKDVLLTENNILSDLNATVQFDFYTPVLCISSKEFSIYFKIKVNEISY